jgi:hypothetical protein
MAKPTTSKISGLLLIILAVAVVITIRVIAAQQPRFTLQFTFDPHYEDGRRMPIDDVETVELWRIDETGTTRVKTIDPKYGDVDMRLPTGCYLIRAISRDGDQSIPSEADCTADIDPVDYAHSLFPKRPQ